MIITNEHNARLRDFVENILARHDILIRAVGILKIANIFTAARSIDSPNFPLNAGKSVKLPGGASRS